MDNELSSLRGLVDSLASERAGVGSSLQSLEVEVDKQRSAASSLTSQLHAAQAELNAAKAERDDAMARLSSTEGRLPNYESKIKGLTNEVVQLTAARDGALDAMASSERELTELRSHVERLDSEQANLRVEMHALTQERDEAWRHSAGIRVERDELREQLGDARRTVENHEVKLAQLTSSQTSLQADLDRLTEQRNAVEVELARFSVQRVEAQDQIRALFSSLAAELGKAEAERDRLTRQLEKSTARLANARDAVSAATSSINSEIDGAAASVEAAIGANTDLGVRLSTVENDTTANVLYQLPKMPDDVGSGSTSSGSTGSGPARSSAPADDTAPAARDTAPAAGAGVAQGSDAAKAPRDLDTTESVEPAPGVVSASRVEPTRFPGSVTDSWRPDTPVIDPGPERWAASSPGGDPYQDQVAEGFDAGAWVTDGGSLPAVAPSVEPDYAADRPGSHVGGFAATLGSEHGVPQGFAEAPTHEPRSYAQQPSSYGQPPAFEPGVYEAPVHEAPAYDPSPAFEAPTYEAPAYDQPAALDHPGYQQQAADTPVYGQQPVAPPADLGGHYAADSWNPQTHANVVAPQPAPVDTARARQLTSQPDVVVLIDGDGVADLGWPTLDVHERRSAVVSYLADMATRSGAAPDVVFDGERNDPNNLPVSRAVRVRRTIPGVGPGLAVSELVSSYPESWPLVVVSDDTTLAAQAQQAGASVLSCGELLDLFLEE